MAIFACVFALSLPLSAHAIHNTVPAYKLLIEKPFQRLKDELETEFGGMALGEIREYVDREEVWGREWRHPPQELMRPLQRSLEEFGQNALGILKEEVTFVAAVDRFFERYGHPRIDARFDDNIVEVSLRKPIRALTRGFRIGVAAEFENFSRADEIITPLPFLQIGWGNFAATAAFNPLHSILRVKLESADTGIFGVKLRGLYERGFEDSRERSEFSALKQVFPESDIWVKLRFRLENAENARDFFWMETNGWEVAAFLFFRF